MNKQPPRIINSSARRLAGLPTYQPWGLLFIALTLLPGSMCSACLAQQPLAARMDKATLEKLVQALGSEKFAEREEAARKLVEAGEAALDIVQEATMNSDPEVKRRAIVCLEQIKHNLAIAKLIAQLQSPKRLERAKAAIDLEKFGSSAAAAVPTLIRALDDQDAHVQDCAMNTLSFMGSVAKPAIPKLIALLEDEKLSDAVRGRVLVVLSTLGDTASDATPCLLKLVKRNKYTSMVASVLGKVGKKQDEVVPLLITLLRHEDVNVRGSAAASLGVIGKQPAVVVPMLADMLRTYKPMPETSDLRMPVLGGLGHFGPDASPAVPVLTSMLDKHDSNLFVLGRVCWVLRRIGPKARSAVPTLRAIRETPIGSLLENDVVAALKAIQESQ